jgi:DNA polymerase elongation subunit (family B)
MLIDFLRYWKDVNPHITTGWNTDGFDDPYIYHRIKKVLGDKEASSLSPFGKVNVRTYEKFGKAETSVDFVGVACLDYKQIYETFTFHSMPDYKLDTVAEYELGENKVEYEGSFKDFYTNEWDKFCTYSVKDTVLVRELDLKTDLMSVAITVAQFCGVNLADTFGSVNKIDVACYNFLKNRNKIIPPKKEVESGSYPGAFVREPKPGLYTAVASFDLASLYPSIIRQHNISPETLVRNKDKTVSELSTSVSIEKMVNGSIDLSALKEYNYSLCPNGAVYDHNKVGFLAELMTEWYNGRKTEKKNSFNHWNNAKSAKEELKKRGISV